jgi:hypothetical protein
LAVLPVVALAELAVAKAALAAANVEVGQDLVLNFVLGQVVEQENHLCLVRFVRRIIVGSELDHCFENDEGKIDSNATTLPQKS